jgi:hypothetical protein
MQIWHNAHASKEEAGSIHETCKNIDSVEDNETVTLGSHSGAAEDSGLLGCYYVPFGKWLPMLRMIVMPSSSAPYKTMLTPMS